METSKYATPDAEWLKNQFAHLPLGVVRPSEMEIILAYMLMFYNDDLGKNEYDLAKDYRLSEAKALRLKAEFDKRWGTKSWDDIVFNIGEKIFGENRSIELETDDKRVSFILADPTELNALKRALDLCGMPYQGNNNEPRRRAARYRRSVRYGFYVGLIPMNTIIIASFNRRRAAGY